MHRRRVRQLHLSIPTQRKQLTQPPVAIVVFRVQQIQILALRRRRATRVRHKDYLLSNAKKVWVLRKKSIPIPVSHKHKAMLVPLRDYLLNNVKKVWVLRRRIHSTIKFLRLRSHLPAMLSIREYSQPPHNQQHKTLFRE
jgi:hypothetical protein